MKKIIWANKGSIKHLLATQFYNCATEMWKKEGGWFPEIGIKIPGWVKQPDPMLVFPVIVNAAFSIELFLKWKLESLNITYKREHDLKCLYESLPIDFQEEIRAKYREVVIAEAVRIDEAVNNRKVSVDSLKRNLTEEQIDLFDVTFLGQLDFIKLNFVQARYLDKPVSLDPEVVVRILEAVKRCITD